MGRVLGQVMAAEEKPVDYQCKAMEWMMNFKEVNSVNDCCYHVWNCYDREPYAQGRLRLIHENNIDLLWELGRCPERDLSEREMSYVAGFLENIESIFAGGVLAGWGAIKCGVEITVLPMVLWVNVPCRILLDGAETYMLCGAAFVLSWLAGSICLWNLCMRRYTSAGG